MLAARLASAQPVVPVRELSTVDATSSQSFANIFCVRPLAGGYGPRAAPLIPYLADSSLFVDGVSMSLLVSDLLGNVSHEFLKTGAFGGLGGP